MSKAVSSDSGVDFASLKIAPAIHNPEKVICVGLGVEDPYGPYITTGGVVFVDPRNWVFIRSHNFFRRGKCGAIRSNNFQISPKVGGYKVSGRFCVRPYNHPPCK